MAHMCECENEGCLSCNRLTTRPGCNRCTSLSAGIKQVKKLDELDPMPLKMSVFHQIRMRMPPNPYYVQSEVQTVLYLHRLQLKWLWVCLFIHVSFCRLHSQSSGSIIGRPAPGGTSAERTQVSEVLLHPSSLSGGGPEQDGSHVWPGVWWCDGWCE